MATDEARSFAQQQLDKLPGLHAERDRRVAHLKAVMAKVDAGESPMRAQEIAQQQVNEVARHINTIENTVYSRAIGDAPPDLRSALRLVRKRLSNVRQECLRQFKELEHLRERRRQLAATLAESGPGWEAAGDTEGLADLRRSLDDLNREVDDSEQVAAEVTARLERAEAELRDLKAEAIAA